MPDLSKLSDDDLRALKGKDYSKLSDEGLRILKSDTPADTPAERPDAWEASRMPQRERAVYGGLQGITGMGVGLAQKFLPESVQTSRPFQAVRNWATGPTGGNIAQAGGRIVGPAFVAGPIARAAGAVAPEAVSGAFSQLPGWAQGAATGGTLSGLTTPTDTTSIGEAWRESAVPAALGVATGGLAGQAVDARQARDAASAAFQASRAAWDRTNAANQAAYNAAMQQHPAAMRDWAANEQLKGLKYQRDLATHRAEARAYPGSLADYQQKQAAWNAANQARQGFRPFDPQAANVEAYKWAMEPIGGTAPTTPGPEGLLQMRNDIGAKLNETAADMSFYPEQDTINALRNPETSDLLRGNARFKADFRRIVTGPLQLTQLEDGTFEIGRGMSGKQYGDYVSSIRQAADRYAQSARGPVGTDPDKLAMARELHKAIDTIENAADAPPGVKEARAQAREAYKRWATIDAASPVQRGEIADPGRILRAMDRRMSRGQYVSDPMRQQVEAWRVQQGLKPPPSPGARPTPPSPPRAEPLRPPRTKPPAEPKRPGPAPNEPQPPAESPRAKWPGRVGSGIGGYAGWELGRRLGHPFIGGTLGGAVGRGVGDIAGGAGSGLGRLVGQIPTAGQAGMTIGAPAGQLGAPLAPTIDDLVAAMMGQ